ncbi:MAG: phosphoribosylanthranilate isomerase [Akkermansiaceae bacterium]|jgi:phosphoribosylanthranilate isomerase|nr:phosphoribosylanthranilate isomerase [Akkermansiaceae bacterium]MDP4719758.1 phosphoribosylanthranilate isomerase [Akkermansiaceae bacterium]MDP4846069.1 phosphoribosylanthranilate isomerase [Akkermansiaceae bacterium]MDP4996813.1 phosphoribosylanthranilate isomerase [Akkermansiaceae bacterium]
MDFFGKDRTALKICGVRMREDAEKLVELGVDAVGFNFWPKSKRYLAPEEGRWMKELAGNILRVGVFVNEAGDLPFRLFGDGMIDVVQLHGDETPEVVGRFTAAGIPVVKALGVKDEDDIARAGEYAADGILLDAHAPVVFGGTGQTFDWGLAKDFMKKYPGMPVILAGGITPENAADAVAQVRPTALDVASGAEVSPGVKDFVKVKALLAACRA